MTRFRASVLFVCLAGAEFVFQQLQQFADSRSEFASMVLVLLIVISLLALVLSAKLIVLYGVVVVIVALATTGLDLVNEDLSGTSKMLSLIGGLSIVGVLTFALRNIARVTWKQSRRYTPASDDPWVSLDKGTDPTIGSAQEGS